MSSGDRCDISQGYHVADCPYRLARQSRSERWDGVNGNTARVEVRRVMELNKLQRESRRLEDCKYF